MRWRYLDPGNDPDAAARARVRAAIDRLWSEFDRRHRGAGRDVVGWLSPLILAVHPDLEWETCPGENGREGLALSAAADPALQPLIDVTIAAAPRLDSWTFYPARRAFPADLARKMVSARLGQPFHEPSFHLEPGQHNTVAIEAVAEGFSGQDREQDLVEGALAVAYVLGEERFRRWIKGFRSRPPRRGLFRRQAEPGLVPLDALASAVDDVVLRITATLPDEIDAAPPTDEAPGAVFKLQPGDRDDYPGWSDLFVASAARPELWHATHTPGFRSARFSRRGETFGYLKVDGRDGLPHCWPDRGYLEDELTDLLESNQAGTVLSGGTGKIYAYIELVFRDVDSGARLVNAMLRKGGINKRTWILFHDDELADEWIGVYPDTPPPPSRHQT